MNRPHFEQQGSPARLCPGSVPLLSVLSIPLYPTALSIILPETLRYKNKEIAAHNACSFDLESLVHMVGLNEKVTLYQAMGTYKVVMAK
jgi:hypothetical protein